MDLRVIVMLNLLIVMPLIYPAASSAESSGSVVFFDAPGQRYIRSNPSKTTGEANSLLADEVAAAISVLLGFAPPSSLHADSSFKLNEVLSPNPFDRPHAVLVLEVGGVEHPSLSADYLNSKLASTSSHRLLGSTVTDIQLPDENGVFVVQLDENFSAECDAFCADKELGYLAQLLGGSYVGTLGSFDGELKLPLASGDSINLRMTKKADKQFALSLVSLVRNINKAADLHEDIAVHSVNPTELMIGRFTGIEALKEEYGMGDVLHQGQELFHETLAKSFDLLQKSYKGNIVGVLLFTNERELDSEAMISVKFPTRASRWMQEESPYNPAIVEVILVRRTLAWITAIILLVSTIIGIYLLLNMPLTRDTLLYSNVKLD